MNACVTFATKVDRRSRKAMTDFLLGHERYHTMNSNNDATSYANNVKLHRVLPSELQDRGYDMLDVPGIFDDINDLLSDWAAESNYSWQAAFNGRSGGYLVLYQGGRKPSEYKRACWDCGQKNYKATSTVCGRCHSTNMHDFTGFQVFTWPGKGVDHRFTEDDFADMAMYQLRERVEEVQSFDRLCDTVVAAFIDLCENNTVEDEIVMVPTPVRVLHPLQGATA
jgi:hypothetical protein